VPSCRGTLLICYGAGAAKALVIDRHRSLYTPAAAAVQHAAGLKKHIKRVWSTNVTLLLRGGFLYMCSCSNTREDDCPFVTVARARVFVLLAGDGGVFVICQAGQAAGMLRGKACASVAFAPCGITPRHV